MSVPVTTVLPPATRRCVRAFVARRRGVLAVRAAGGACSVFAAAALAACVADRYLRFDPAVRWALLGTAVALGGAVLLRGLALALRPVPLAAVAAQVEARTPAFGQRLVTVASAPAPGVSPALLERLLGEVEAIAARQSRLPLVPWRAAALPWAGFAAVACAVGATWPVDAIGMPRLIARLAHPGRAIDPVTITLLEVSPRNVEVSQGASLPITATASGARAAAVGARGVELYLSTDGRHWSHAAMSPTSLAPEAARFTFLLPSIDRDLRYYVRGGDAASDVYLVRVKRAPAVAEFHVRYAYPAYARHAPTVAANADGTLEALAGCEAHVTIVATEPLASAELTVGAGPGAARYAFAPAPTNRATDWQVTVPVTQDATMSLEMTSAAGVSGRGPSPMLMRALPDREPAVALDQPGSDLRLSPAEAVTVRFRAADDYGLQSVEAAVQLNASAAAVVPLALPPRALRRHGEFAVNLADLSPRPGDVVTLTVRARDGLGQLGVSEARRVLVAPQSVGAVAHARVAELRRAASLAAAWGEAAQRARAAVGAARAGDARSPRQQQELWSQANRALGAAAEAAAAVRQALVRAVVRTNAPPLAQALGAYADDAALQLIDPGRALGGQPVRADDPVFRRAEAAVNTARADAAALATLAQGEEAGLLLTEIENLAALAAVSATTTKPADRASADLRAAAVDAANRSINDGLRRLNLQRGAGLDGQLRGRVRAAADVVAAARPRLDVPAVVADWAQRLRAPGSTGAEAPARLFLASQLEALGPGGDAALARDLRLAARAASALAGQVAAARDAERARTKGNRGPGGEPAAALARVFEPLARYREAADALFRDRGAIGQGERATVAAVEARRWMAQVLGEGESAQAPAAGAAESPEDLAFDASAAEAEGHAERAVELDARLSDEIAHASQDEAARFQEDAARLRQHAERVRGLIARQGELRRRVADGEGASTPAAAEQARVADEAEALNRAGDATAVVVSAAAAPAGDAGGDEAARPAGASPPASADPPSALAALHHPLAAAAWHARRAAEGLGVIPFDRARVAAEQQSAADLLNAALRRTLRKSAARRLEAAPALASVFQPLPPDDAGGVGQAVAGDPAARSALGRWQDWFHAPGTPDSAAGSGAPGRDPNLSGYQDQLKAYWDSISKPAPGGGRP